MVKTVEEAKRKELYKVIEEVLGDNYINLQFKNIKIEESFGEEGVSFISGTLEEQQNDSTVITTLEATGRGVLDAVFGGILDHYSEDYPSLKNISFVGFSMKPNFSTKTKSGSDAEVEVVIQLSNSSNSVMTFRRIARSFVMASVSVLTTAMEFYINSEKAFKKLKFLIADASKRNRSDVRQTYVSKISKIVGVTSYEEV